MVGSGGGRPLALAFVVAVAAMAISMSTAEVFSAMANIDMLIETEKSVVALIDKYIETERRRLSELESLARDYKEKNQEVIAGGENVVANPIDAFLLIRRLTGDWSYAEQLMRHNSADEFIRNITLERESSPVRFPEPDDFEGAAVAILRLQDVYRLNTHDMAEGKIMNVDQGQKMDALDCFSIGQVAYRKQNYYHTLMWMQEALDRVRKEDPPTADVGEILEHLAFAQFQQGNVERALYTTRMLAELRPDHARAKGNIKYYENMMNPEFVSKQLDEESLPPLQNRRPDDVNIPERDMYEALCRMDIPMSPSVAKDLYCYFKRDRPYLRLAPIKVEVMNWKPKIMFFRHVLSDYEIATLKELALPLLRRATVHNAETGELETASYRVSKNAWLKDEDHPVVKRVCRRVDDMTNLNMETAELLQIANYGIGGHYDPHFDMSTREQKDPYEALLGNRVATVLFYMSQPLAGGGTVFTSHKASIPPSKYDAAFWHNIKRSGETDLSTLHAACPVLSGTKWVANKWIHERGQEFRRPCALNEDEYV